MNIKTEKSANIVIVICECIKGYAFKTVMPRGKSALFVEGFADVSIFCARVQGFFAKSRYNCVRFDVASCLSLINIS